MEQKQNRTGQNNQKKQAVAKNLQRKRQTRIWPYLTLGNKYVLMVKGSEEEN